MATSAKAKPPKKAKKATGPTPEPKPGPLTVLPGGKGPSPLPVLTEVGQEGSDGGADGEPIPDPYAPPPLDVPHAYPGHPSVNPHVLVHVPVSNDTVEGRLARRARALELRIQGLSYPEIAVALGNEMGRSMSVATAYYDVQHSLLSLAKYHTSLAEQVRDLEVARLDIATQALMPAVAKGSTYAIDSLLKVMTRRATLLGLDTEMAQVEVQDGPMKVIRRMSADQLTDRLEQLRARQTKLRRMGKENAEMRHSLTAAATLDPGANDV